MQKDFHFHVTDVLACKAGIEEPLIVAWANQYTDELKKARLHGIQTQSGILGNWADRQIQRTVLVPFHFLPGDNLEKTCVVTPDSRLARMLIDEAGDFFELGIALHSFQDTYSHQGFTGWLEKENECFPWWYLGNPQPPIGHAEMGVIPDVVSAEWTDLRTGIVIDNRRRALACAKRTYEILCGFTEKENNWPDLRVEFQTLFAIRSYDERKKTLLKLGSGKRFSELTYSKTYRDEFETAAAKQLGIVTMA